MLCLQFQGHTLESVLAIILKLQVCLFKDTPKVLSYLLIQNTYFFGKKMTCITSTPSLPAEWKEPCACWISALSPTLGKCCTISFSLRNTCSKASSSCLRLSLPSFSLAKMCELGKTLGARCYFSLAYIFCFASICLLLYDKDCQVLVAAS